MGAMPMLAAGRTMLEKMDVAAQNVADESGHEIRLVRFERVRVVKEFHPNPAKKGESNFLVLTPEQLKTMELEIPDEEPAE